MTPFRLAFLYQRSEAKRRGILFLLTFEEWLSFWQESGHLHERGRRRGQYCMARFGDIGPYVLGNVKIIQHSDNVIEGQLGSTKSEETKKKISEGNMGDKEKAQN